MTATRESVRRVTAKLPFTFAVVLLFVLSFLLLQRIDNMRSAADLVSHTNIVRLHPDDMPAVTVNHKRLETGDTDVVEYEYRIRNKAGIYQHFFAREGFLNAMKTER